MYFSRIQLQPDLAVRDLPQAVTSPYQQHKLIWRMYADHKDRKRDFVYRQDQMSDGRPSFYVVSKRKPEDPDDIWLLETKDYQPAIRQGDMLRFSVRVNPVVSRSDNKIAKRHDVVMDRKRKLGWKELSIENKPGLQEVIYQAGLEWLQKRAPSHGFEILPDHLRIEGYATHKFFKSPGTSVTISTLDFQGVMQVTDPEKLIRTLFDGIGPAKGFGCGLLMVRR